MAPDGLINQRLFGTDAQLLMFTQQPAAVIQLVVGTAVRQTEPRPRQSPGTPLAADTADTAAILVYVTYTQDSIVIIVSASTTRRYLRRRPTGC